MAVGDFPDGATATHKDGRKIVFKNGEWHVAPGSAAKPTGGSKVTEGERKASSFLTRALGANTSYEDQKVGPRGLVGQNFRDAFPNASNYIASDEQQVADTAQDEFIAASLRQDSGAAIPEEELERQRRIYFPMPGDGEAAIKAKAAARQRAIQGLLASAGNGVDEKLKAQYPSFFNPEGGDQASGAAGATGGSGTPPTDPNGPGAGKELVFNDQLPTQSAAALPLTDEQKSGLQAIAQSGGGAAQIMALARSYGTNISQENADALAKFYADPKNRNVVPVVNEDRTVKPVDPGDGVLGRGTVGATAQGIANAATLGFFDEGAALVDTVAQGGTYADNLDRRRGMEMYDEQNNGGARIAGQILGSLPLGGVEFASGRAASLAAGRSARLAGATEAEAATVANRVLASRTAIEAAGIGGVYGFGDTEGSFTDRLGGAALNAGVSALGGYAIARGGGRFARAMAARKGGSAEPSPAQLFGEAAERRNVSYLPADVPDATATRMASGLSNVTFGAIPLSEAATKSVASAKAAKSAVADSIGVAGDATRAGQAIQRGANTMIDTTQGRSSSLYEAIPIRAQANATINNTKAALSDLTAGFESNPELSKLIDDPRLKAFEAAFAGRSETVPTGILDAAGTPLTRTVQRGGSLSWQDLKSFRTYIGEKLGGPQLQSDTPRKALKALYGALSADMEATATASGPKALNAFNRANTYYRAREGRIENVLSTVLGKDLNKSPDAAFRAVEAMANARTGDPLKLARLIRSLPDDEANAVRATVLDKLGLASAGRQDGTQEVYSPAEFMTQWSKLSERAKSVLFGGEHKEAVNDLVRIAEGMKASTQFANTSRTTLGTNALATAATLWANPLAGILAVGGQFGAGKLLSSQRFAKWLTRAPKKPNVQAQRAHVASLSSIARAEPAIAADVLSLQQRLIDTFGSAPTRLAANERDRHADVVERQESNGATANQRLQP